ncbi:hypothetical protein ACIOUF_17675 [Pseudomonas iridis]|uniref:Ead/Ea22-like family protein n=1 Tax=Pseudomonas iridis TaxID=2710587 RepID=A0ABW8DNS5_9PSED
MNAQWKLVPVEPTQSILDAMTTERKKGNGVLQMWFEAMAAAPAPPLQADGVDFGIDGRSVRVSQEAYSIFLAREAAGREKIAALQVRLNAADQRIDDFAAAAEPFAKVADLYAGEEDNSHEPARDVGMHDDLRLTLGQFRALSDLCTRPLMVGCKKGILCGDVNCECKGNGFVVRKTSVQPFTEQFIEDHLGKRPQ